MQVISNSMSSKETIFQIGLFLCNHWSIWHRFQNTFSLICRFAVYSNSEYPTKWISLLDSLSACIPELFRNQLPQKIRHFSFLSFSGNTDQLCIDQDLRIHFHWFVNLLCTLILNTQLNGLLSLLDSLECVHLLSTGWILHVAITLAPCYH